MTGPAALAAYLQACALVKDGRYAESIQSKFHQVMSDLNGAA